MWHVKTVGKWYGGISRVVCGTTTAESFEVREVVLGVNNMSVGCVKLHTD
jgi:hypothetical protein